eukprot:389836-Amphidinium_carterae.1
MVLIMTCHIGTEDASTLTPTKALLKLLNMCGIGPLCGAEANEQTKSRRWTKFDNVPSGCSSGLAYSYIREDG